MIEVDQEEVEEEVRHDPIHQSLECSRGSGQTRWHSGILKEAKGCCEGCLVLIFGVHSNLVIPTGKVKGCKVL